MATKTVVSSEADNPDDPNTQYVNVYSDGTTDTSSSPLEIGSTVGSADSSSSSSSSSSDSGPKIVNSFTAKDGSTVSEMSDGTYQQDGKTIDEATYNQLNTETANANETPSVAGSGAPSNNPLANLGTQIQNLLKGGGLGSAATTAGLAALAKALGGGSSSGLAGGTAGVYRGYQGGIPTLTASRNMNQIPANYRPGGGGLSYFSPITFTDPSGNVVSGVAGSGSPMNKGDATGNITGPTSAGSLTPTNTLLPGGITTVGNTYVPPTTTTTTTNTGTTNTGTTNTGTTNTGTTNTGTNNTTVNKPTTTTLTPAQQLLASLQNPTASGIAQFQAGTPSQITSGIQNALNAVGSPGTPAANKTIAGLMDTWEVTPTEMAAATGLSTSEITNLYNQAKGITATPQTTSMGDIQSQLENAATAMGSGNANARATGIAAINNIVAANPGITISQIQNLFPGQDLTPFLQAGAGTNAAGASSYKYVPLSSTDIGSAPNPSGMSFADTITAANAAPANTATTDNTAAGINSLAASPVVTTTAAPAAPTYTPYTQQQMSDYVSQNNINVADPVALAQAEAATNADPNAVNAWIAQSAADTTYGASGGIMQSSFARGGFAQGGISSLGTYSDGGRMLKGPGDGVSDSIPATIGGHQKAALADGEFVIPARIVSEIGNGSSDAGARKLYAMMDRIQNARKKTTKNVAANTRAEKYLPG